MFTSVAWKSRVLFLFSLMLFLSIPCNMILAQNNDSLTILIKGELAEVEQPMITTSDNGRVYIIWGETFGRNYGGSDVIYIQELDSSGIAIDEKTVVVNHEDISGNIGLGHQQIKTDSRNNIHLFWGVFDPYGNSGSIYYKKLDANLNTLVDTKRIVAHPFNSFQHSSIQDVYIDKNDSIHLLTHEKYYIYMDIEGNILDSFNIEDEEIGEATCLEIDSTGNVFISTLNDSHYIYLLRLESMDNSTSKVGLYTVFTDFVNYIREPRLVHNNNSLHIFCRIYHSGSDDERFCKVIDYSGNILSSSNTAMSNIDIEFHTSTFNYLSRNRSNVFSISVNQDGCDRENSVLNFSLYTFHNDSLVSPKNFLTILNDPKYTHGPSVFGLRGNEDINGYFWLCWYVNAGNNGFQVMYLKLDNQGNPCFNVIAIAPEYFQYSASNNLSWMGVSSLSVFFVVVVLMRKRKKP